MSKIKHILSVIHYTICGAVCFHFTHFSCDYWDNIYILSYHHHQIGCMNYYPLFRVRSWNNGVRCKSFYILMYWCLTLHHKVSCRLPSHKKSPMIYTYMLQCQVYVVMWILIWERSWISCTVGSGFYYFLFSNSAFSIARVWIVFIRGFVMAVSRGFTRSVA